MALVSEVREFTSRFYEAVLKDDDALSRLAVATHELLENAVKNATDGVARVRVEFMPATQKIEIRTLNRPTPENLALLCRNIDAINAAPDLDLHYQRLLEESTVRTDGSGLGLGRIAAEARFAIHYQVEAPAVWVIAESPVSLSGSFR